MVTVVHVSEYGDAINYNTWERSQLSKKEQDSLPDSAAIKYIINVEHLRDIPQMASTDKLIVIDHELPWLEIMDTVSPLMFTY
jgi:hypothetical protein